MTKRTSKAPAKRRGRPSIPAGEGKTRITIRLDQDIVERFKATGPGWQTRLNNALKAQDHG